MTYKNPWYNAALAHHTPEGFRNPEPELRQKGDLQRWRHQRKQQGLPKPPAQGYKKFVEQWWQPADLSGSEDAVWWLGHASILIRTGLRYTLIDPVFSERASPVPFAGPKRRTPAPLTVAMLPELDSVLISHNHYDHLDRATIVKIVKRFPDVRFVVPLGLAAWFHRIGIRSVVELDWWQSAEVGQLTVHAVPARHWSMRTLRDRNRSLWCGWVVQNAKLNFWFSGDSGYSDNLLAIPARLGPFNLAALPTGAWAPEWFMRGQHMDPDDAVKLHDAIGRPLTLPIHWGVFELADESLDDPPQALRRAMERAGLDDNRFHARKIGSRIMLGNICQDYS